MISSGYNSASTPGLAQQFRDAMSLFPSGVTIVTTKDDTGRCWGFTATSFCSVSVQPPMVLVCLAKTAQCCTAFTHASSWLINVLSTRHAPLAVRFATRGAEKFADGDFVLSANGHPMLKESCTVLECESVAKYDAGTHTMLLGQVTAVKVNEYPPVVYVQRAFHVLKAAPIHLNGAMTSEAHDDT